MNQTRLALFVLVLVCAVTSLARAQETPPAPDAEADARTLFERGREAASAERWGEAVDFFRRARALADRPSIDFNLGVSLFTLGRHVEAIEVLEHFLARADPTADAPDIATATELMGQARGAVVHVILDVDPPDAELRIDGAPRAGTGASREVLLDPGHHQLEASAAGHADGAAELDLLAGTREHVVLRLELLAPRLEVASGTAGATLLIDGEEVGHEAVELEVAPGPHTVEIRADGFQPHVAEIQAQAGETVRVHADLARVPEAPLYESPILWTIVGVVVVGAAVGIGVGVAVASEQPPYGGNANTVVTALRF